MPESGLSAGGLRKAMPTVAAMIDDLREAFGRAEIDGQIRRGMKGEPVFWAREAGQEAGTRLPAIDPVRVTIAERWLFEHVERKEAE